MMHKSDVQFIIHMVIAIACLAISCHTLGMVHNMSMTKNKMVQQQITAMDARLQHIEQCANKQEQ